MKSIQAIERARERSSRWYIENKDKPEFKAKTRLRTQEWRGKNLKKYILQHARQRSKDYNVPCTIEEDDIIIPEVCPILKTPFVFNTYYTYSIDRIIPELGYVPGNIQIISMKANAMKQNATNEELKKFAEWINRSTV